MSKEFLALLRDKMVFSYAATFDLNHIPYAVYEQDSDFVSRELLGRFHGSSAFQQVATITHGGQVAPLINHQKALLVLQIGPNFTRDLLLHHPASVQVIIDGRNSNTAGQHPGAGHGAVPVRRYRHRMDDLVARHLYHNPMRYFLMIVRGVFLEGDGVHELWSQYAVRWP